jgi:hypothetical protein
MHLDDLVPDPETTPRLETLCHAAGPGAPRADYIAEELDANFVAGASGASSTGPQHRVVDAL